MTFEVHRSGSRNSRRYFSSPKLSLCANWLLIGRPGSVKFSVFHSKNRIHHVTRLKGLALGQARISRSPGSNSRAHSQKAPYRCAFVNFLELLIERSSGNSVKNCRGVAPSRLRQNIVAWIALMGCRGMRRMRILPLQPTWDSNYQFFGGNSAHKKSKIFDSWPDSIEYFSWDVLD